MPLFGKKKAEVPLSTHERRVVGDDHKVATLPPREAKPSVMSPQEAEAVAWRKQEDAVRATALAEG